MRAPFLLVALGLAASLTPAALHAQAKPAKPVEISADLGLVNTSGNTDVTTLSANEKVVLNSAAIKSPGLVREAAAAFGSQSVVVAIDIKRDWLGRTRVRYCGGRKTAKVTLEQHLAAMQEAGAGELVINSIDRDGTRSGYDIDSLRLAATSVTVPVIALGGAGSLDHMREAADQAGVSALAAGSLFVFHGPNRAVLIQYPGYAALGDVFSGSPVR